MLHNSLARISQKETCIALTEAIESKLSNRNNWTISALNDRNEKKKIFSTFKAVKRKSCLVRTRERMRRYHASVYTNSDTFGESLFIPANICFRAKAIWWTYLVANCLINRILCNDYEHRVVWKLRKQIYRVLI